MPTLYSHTHRGLFYEATCRLCPLITIPGGPGPQVRVQAAPATHLWDPLPPSLLLSSTDGTVSMGAVYRRAEWGFAHRRAEVHTVVTSSAALGLGHVGSSLWEEPSSSAEQGGSHFPLAGLRSGQREAPELTGELPSGQCASSLASPSIGDALTAPGFPGASSYTSREHLRLTPTDLNKGSLLVPKAGHHIPDYSSPGSHSAA